MRQMDLVVTQTATGWEFTLSEGPTLSPPTTRHLDVQTVARIMSQINACPYDADAMGTVLGSGATVGTVYLGDDDTFYIEWNQTAVCSVYDLG